MGTNEITGTIGTIGTVGGFGTRLSNRMAAGGEMLGMRRLWAMFLVALWLGALGLPACGKGGDGGLGGGKFFCEPDSELKLERALKAGYRALYEGQLSASEEAFHEALALVKAQPEAEKGLRYVKEERQEPQGGIFALIYEGRRHALPMKVLQERSLQTPGGAGGDGPSPMQPKHVLLVLSEGEGAEDAGGGEGRPESADSDGDGEPIPRTKPLGHAGAEADEAELCETEACLSDAQEKAGACLKSIGDCPFFSPHLSYDERGFWLQHRDLSLPMGTFWGPYFQDTLFLQVALKESAEGREDALLEAAIKAGNLLLALQTFLPSLSGEPFYLTEEDFQDAFKGTRELSPLMLTGKLQDGLAEGFFQELKGLLSAVGRLER